MSVHGRLSVVGSICALAATRWCSHTPAAAHLYERLAGHGDANPHPAVRTLYPSPDGPEAGRPPGATPSEGRFMRMFSGFRSVCTTFTSSWMNDSPFSV